MIAWHTEKRAIDALKGWESNPRTISSEKFDELVSSIDDLGNFGPLVIDTDGTVVAGNQRLKAYEKLQIKEVEVVVPDRKLTDGEIKKIGILSNRHSGEWDWDIIGNQFEDILKELGIDDMMPKSIIEVEEDSYSKPDDLPSKVVKGDIWQLGRHRLMCGDSTAIGDVEKLMDGNKADMGFNDPPYGMGKESDGVKNDNLGPDDLLKFNQEWIPLQFESLKTVGSWYCWGIDEPLMDIYSEIVKPYIKTQRATFRNLITWDKGIAQGQNSASHRMYPTADEKCLFVMMGVQGFNNNTENYWNGWDPIRLYLENEAEKVGLTAKLLYDITGVQMFSHWFTKSQWAMIPEEHYKKLQAIFMDKHSAFKKDYSALKKEYYDTRAYFDNTHDNQTSVWHFKTTNPQERKGTGDHATPKPIELCARAIKSSCPSDGLVTDWFGGSGSTLIACEQTNRRCFMMELDEHYCDVIIDRWEKLTGETAVKCV